jgi:SM-20-related protein
VRALLLSLAGGEGLGIDAHASWYAPGSFLGPHNDADLAGARRWAWVLHMTRDWREEWGGLLRFTDSPPIVPRFNALTLFRVPREHEVTRVSAGAPPGRYALTGWFTF